MKIRRRALLWIGLFAVMSWISIHLKITNGYSADNRQLRKFDRDLAKRKILDIMDEEDPNLISLIREYFLDPPSDARYNLVELSSKDPNIPYLRYKFIYPSWVFIRSILIDLFKNGKPGFFVEAGAFDGEFLSNTLTLERDYNWTGLLVEANRKSYKDLKAKNRRSWTTPLCLSIGAIPQEVSMRVNCFENQETLQDRGGSKVVKSAKDIEELAQVCFENPLCVPTSSLLLALNITKVDVFSLDIEDAEVEMLKRFPFDKVQVDVWVIEHSFRGYLKALERDPDSDTIQDVVFTEFMEANGYYLFDLLCSPIADYVFISRSSDIFRNLHVPHEEWKRRKVCKAKGMVEHNITNVPSELRDFHHFPNVKYTKII